MHVSTPTHNHQSDEACIDASIDDDATPTHIVFAAGLQEGRGMGGRNIIHNVTAGPPIISSSASMLRSYVLDGDEADEELFFEERASSRDDAEHDGSVCDDIDDDDDDDDNRSFDDGKAALQEFVRRFRHVIEGECDDDDEVEDYRETIRAAVAAMSKRPDLKNDPNKSYSYASSCSREVRCLSYVIQNPDIHVFILACMYGCIRTRLHVCL